MLFTVYPPWHSLAKTLKNNPEQVFFIHETDKQILDGLVPKAAGIKKVVGIGGGRAYRFSSRTSLCGPEAISSQSHR